MSTRPTQQAPITLTKLVEKKALGETIAMVTAYDNPSAQVAEESGVDVVVGLRPSSASAPARQPWPLRKAAVAVSAPEGVSRLPPPP